MNRPKVTITVTQDDIDQALAENNDHAGGQCNACGCLGEHRNCSAHRQWLEAHDIAAGFSHGQG